MSTNGNPQSPTAARRPNQADIPEAELLQAVLDRSGITRWDLLLVGDGSGTGWNDACGSACVAIDRETRGRMLFRSAMHPASVNVGEIMPYVHALGWFHAQYGRSRLHRVGHLNVHVLTDSQVLANWGTRAADLSQPLPVTNFIFLAALREAARQGYVLHFHWAPRSTSLLNWAADLVAGLSRRALLRTTANPTDLRLCEQALAAIRQVEFADPSGVPINLHDLNPIEEFPCPTPSSSPSAPASG